MIDIMIVKDSILIKKYIIKSSLIFFEVRQL
jgi:hypothetical protein